MKEILAEKAAWNFVEEKKKAGQAVFDLAVICPTFVMGPLLSNVFGTSGTFFQMNFNSGDAPPASPDMYFPICDVRDVALAVIIHLKICLKINLNIRFSVFIFKHYRAAVLPEALGKRHIGKTD